MSFGSPAHAIPVITTDLYYLAILGRLLGILLGIRLLGVLKLSLPPPPPPHPPPSAGLAIFPYTDLHFLILPKITIINEVPDNMNYITYRRQMATAWRQNS